MSARVGAALAHSNIAFSKYWGKRPYPGNYPATPSLSMTLDALTTRTRVTFDASLSADRFILGDGSATKKEQAGTPLTRVTALLDRLRVATGTREHAEVVSQSDFPAASGLASSASGFAALALAAVHALRLDWDVAKVSDLARASSASAARSLYGGFVELLAGSPNETREPLSASAVAPPGQVDWRLVVAIAGEGKKAIGSTSGMEETRRLSPYYSSWLDLAPGLHAELKEALAARDLARFGARTEESAFAMHASAMAAQVIYFSGVTLLVLAKVRELRDGGTPAYATMDAGPHVKVLCRGEDAAAVAASLRSISGVTRVLEARPGEGARVIPADEVPL
jgi:diphosphomevalonate decarboxylase